LFFYRVLYLHEEFDQCSFVVRCVFEQENTRLLRQTEAVVVALQQEQARLKNINGGLAAGLKKYQDALEELHPQVMELKIVQNENVKVGTCFGGWLVGLWLCWCLVLGWWLVVVVLVVVGGGWWWWLVVLVSWLPLLMTTAFALFILEVADVFRSLFSELRYSLFVLRCHGQLKDEMARLQDIQSSDVFILTNEMKRLRSQQDINVENEQYAIAIRMRLVSAQLAQLAHRHIGASVHWKDLRCCFMGIAQLLIHSTFGYHPS